MTLDQLKARREELRDDLLRATGAMVKSQWYRDRLREAESLGRQIDRIEAMTAAAK